MVPTKKSNRNLQEGESLPSLTSGSFWFKVHHYFAEEVNLEESSPHVSQETLAELNLLDENGVVLQDKLRVFLDSGKAATILDIDWNTVIEALDDGSGLLHIADINAFLESQDKTLNDIED